MYVQILARTFAISRKKKRVEKRVGKKWLAIKVFGVLLHVVGWCKGLANFQHRLSPRWNALVDWHSMLHLKGLPLEDGHARRKALADRECGVQMAVVARGNHCSDARALPATYHLHIATVGQWGYHHIFWAGRHRNSMSNKWEFLVATMNILGGRNTY